MGGPSFIGAIDQGTTSTRFILYDSSANAVASHQLEFQQIYPQRGLVEHDPMEILETIRVCIRETLAKANVKGENVKAIGVTNQRETTIVWRKSTGEPLYNAIVWMDMRTSSICKRLEETLSGGSRHFVESCGLPLSTYFSALKLIWLVETVPVVKAAVQEGDALFGTVDSWIIWNMTGGTSGGLHVTDCSNAARTMLMNLKTLSWDKQTIESLGFSVPVSQVMSMLPRIISNSEVIGSISEGWPLAGVPLAGCLGDQHAAMLGQQCKTGEAKSTYGTGCFILLNTGEEIVPSRHGLLTTVAYKLGPEAPTCYALEGSIAIAGAAVQWLRDNLGIIRSASEIETLAKTVENAGGVYFVPAFSGLYAPRWRDDARGVCVGITRYTNKAHLARSVLESICFQAREVLDAMLKDAEVQNKDKFVLKVDGGATVNNLLMQIQADVLGTDVMRPKDIETTALGAAYAAGLAVGIWKHEQLLGHEEGAKVFSPNIGEDERNRRYESWCKAVERSYDLSNLA